MIKKPERYNLLKLSLKTKWRKKQKKMWTENVARATAEKTRCVADKSGPLHLSEAVIMKISLKSFIILSVRGNFWSTLWSVFYPDYRKLQFDYRSNVFDRNVISACRHFAQNKHRFNKHAKFTLIGSITNTNKLKDPMRELLQRQKLFLIRTLETVQPHGLNHKLNPGGIVSNYFTI